jgi:hypothetical protein
MHPADQENRPNARAAERAKQAMQARRSKRGQLAPRVSQIPFSRGAFAIRSSWKAVAANGRRGAENAAPRAAVPTLRASPPSQGARPVRRRSPVGRPRPRPRTSRVACAFLVYVLSPLPRHSRRRHRTAHPVSGISLPCKGRQVGLCIVFFEACSAFTRVTARTLAQPPIRGSLIRRLQPVRHLPSRSGCFRLEHSPGGPCTHWKAPPWHGAHPKLASGHVRYRAECSWSAIAINVPLARILALPTGLQHVRWARRNSSRRSPTGQRSSLRSLFRWHRIRGHRIHHELFVRRRPVDRGQRRLDAPASPAVGSAFCVQALAQDLPCRSPPLGRSA